MSTAITSKLLTPACALLLTAFPAAIHAQSGGYVFAPANSNIYIVGRGSQVQIVQRAKLKSRSLDQSFARAASGERIGSAADDPAGLAVAEKMTALMNEMRVRAQNAADFRGYLKHVEAVLGQNTEILKRMRLEALRAQNGILGPDDRDIIQSQIVQLLDQLAFNARYSAHNTHPLIPELTPEGLGLAKLDLVRRPYDAIGLIDAASKRVRYLRAVAGTRERVVRMQIEGQTLYYLDLSSTESRIRDADMAETISKISRDSVILRTGQGLLMKARE
mgnify:CR=1 FL=1